jgi:preprotein translocase subunit SecE
MEKRKELRKTLQQIVVYVIVMSVFENIYDKSDSQAWRIIPSGRIH